MSQKLCEKSGKGRWGALEVIDVGWKSSTARMASKQLFVGLSYTAGWFVVLVCGTGVKRAGCDTGLGSISPAMSRNGKESVKGAGRRL